MASTKSDKSDASPDERPKRRNISLDMPTFNRLAQHGQFGDSGPDLINRLLDRVEGV